MSKYLFLLSIFGANIYFSLMSIFNLNYGGLEEGNLSYWLYLTFLLIATITNSFLIILKKKVISIKELLFMFLPFTFVLLFYLQSIFFKEQFSSTITEQALVSFIFTLPALLAGWYFSYGEKKIIFLSKNLEIIMLIFTLGVLFSTFTSLTSGNRINSIGGGTYQTASYISAFAFGINLFYITFGNIFHRYKIFENSTYKIIQILLLVIQVIGLVLGGGRGAFVLAITYILVISISLISRNKVLSLLKYLFTIIMFLIVFIVISNMPIINENGIMQGFSRMTEFITAEGINWGGTSGRDVVYKNIINIISEYPIFGVGFFNYPLPHNIFLEILISTGLVGFIIALVFFGYIFLKYKILLKENFQYYIYLIIFLYPLVMLMFSRSLFTSPEFSFFMSFVYFSKINSKIKE